MIKTDKEKQWIYLTRGDTADIKFGAKDDQGTEFHPTAKDKLIFSVCHVWNTTPIFTIENEMGSSENEFWTVRFEPEHTKDLEVKKYVYDVEVNKIDSVTGELQDRITIIGKTDTLNPTFVLWGEADD